MRAARALALLAALAGLASCSVDIEGAPCSSGENCPSGQGCGLDGRCSAQAASASCVACQPGDTRCGTGGLESCDTAADGVCSAWTVRGCGDSQQCQTTGTGAACVCVSEPPVCTAEGDVCDASGELVSCGRDQWGCLTEVAQVV
jgi:hypothetical protein